MATDYREIFLGWPVRCPGFADGHVEALDFNGGFGSALSALNIKNVVSQNGGNIITR